MSEELENKEMGTVTTIYHEFESWQVNRGEKTIHAKRMPGFFRTVKNYAQLSLWLPFFLGPYLRWNGNQAILFDIQNRQFHFYGLTVLPQDIWMLSLILLMAAMTLFATTSVASRVWCGYFCFQTAWTDWFTWLEDKIEGNPAARQIGRCAIKSGQDQEKGTQARALDAAFVAHRNQLLSLVR